MVNKKLFILDIDGTLLNSSYESTEPELANLIKKLQLDGHIFALNSNRASEDLIPVAKQFGIEGPLVGENGCFIYFLKTGEKVLLLDKEEITLLHEIRTVIKDRTLAYMKPAYPEVEASWVDTDTVEQISKNDPGHYDEGAFIFLNNKYRKYTMSTHVRKIVNHSYELCPDVLKKLVVYLQKEISMNDVVLTSSTTFNNLLLSPTSVSKRTGVEELLRRYPDHRLIVIGDEMGDFKMSEGLGDFYTVANADDQTKKHAKIVSSYSQTKGVLDILKCFYKSD